MLPCVAKWFAPQLLQKHRHARRLALGDSVPRPLKIKGSSVRTALPADDDLVNSRRAVTDVIHSTFGFHLFFRWDSILKPFFEIHRPQRRFIAYDPCRHRTLQKFWNSIIRSRLIFY